jgi:hypothetical protein
MPLERKNKFEDAPAHVSSDDGPRVTGECAKRGRSREATAAGEGQWFTATCDTRARFCTGAHAAARKIVEDGLGSTP